MRKHLELILTASLPVMILIVGYLAVTSRATIRNSETAYPSGAAPYYRDDAENNEGKHFGPEANSATVCPDFVNNPDVTNNEYNKGFDINGVTESATVTASTVPGAVEFDRTQTWTFGDATPWGSSYVVIARSAPVKWEYIDDNIPPSTTGYPWSGSEYHSRYFWDEDGKYYVFTGSDVTGWRRYERDNRKWICPKYYKRYNDVVYHCSGDEDTHWPREWTIVEKDQFGDPTFRDDAKTILSRHVGYVKPWFDDVWFNCIELN